MGHQPAIKFDSYHQQNLNGNILQEGSAMNTNTSMLCQLDAHLDNILDGVQHLRQLNLATVAECEQALQESRHLLGALALYRHQLTKLEEQQALQLRYAA